MATSAAWQRDPPIFCLTVRWPGRVLRAASQAFHVTDRHGRALPYAPGLEVPDVELRINLDGQGAGPRDVTCRVLSGQDWGELFSQLGPAYKAEAELALYCRSEGWEARHVLLKGRAIPIAWGGRGVPLELQISEPPWEDTGVWPPLDAAVNRLTWPDAPEASLGARYPWVFGRPGQMRDDEGTLIGVPATPAICVDEAGLKLLVAGHPVAATTVIVFNADEAASTTLAVETVSDSRGRRVSVVDFSAMGTWTADQTYYVTDWKEGGHRSEVGPRTLLGLGDLLLFWAARCRLTLDWASWRAVAQRLNAWRIGGYVEEPVPPLQFIRDVLLPLAPGVVLAPTAAGIGLAAWAPAPGRRPHRQITVGATFARVDPRPMVTDSPPISDVRISYGWDLSAQGYKGLVGVTGDAWSCPRDDTGTLRPSVFVPCAFSRASRARHGRPEVFQLETRWLWDRAPAYHVAHDRVFYAWTPPLEYTLSAPLWTLPDLRIGAGVGLVDEENQLRGEWWRICGVSIRGGRVELALAYVEDLISSPRRGST